MNTKHLTLLNLAWKAGVGLIGLTAIVVGLIIAIEWYKERYGRSPWLDKTLSKDVVVEAYNNNCVRVRNKLTGQYTTPKVKWVSGTPERDSLTVYCDRQGKRGFLNVNTGEIVIPAQYPKAWMFSEGLGAVLGEGEKIGFVDKDNRLVIDYTIPYDKSFDYLFKDGFCIVHSWDQGWLITVYAKDGSQILPPECRHISDPTRSGYRIVSGRGGAWLYDKDFNLVFPDTYECIQFEYGKSAVYLTKDHVKQLVDFSGNVIEPFVIDNTYPLKYLTKYNDDEADEYELVSDIVVYQVNGWEGLLDARTGKTITPAVYWTFEMISKDLIRADLGQEDGGVILDRRGRIVRCN